MLDPISPNSPGGIVCSEPAPHSTSFGPCSAGGAEGWGRGRWGGIGKGVRIGYWEPSGHLTASIMGGKGQVFWPPRAPAAP